MVAEGKEKQCRVCHCGFGASVWKYKCTYCAHYFCSSHCKDLWLRADDVDEDEEDPFTVLKDEEAPGDPISPRRRRIGGLLGGALCGRLIVGQQVQRP